jgi:hypothetical protein
MSYTGTLLLSDGVTMDNPCVLKTVNNVLLFLDNAQVQNYNSGSVLATLPESSLFPSHVPIKIPVAAKSGLAILTINTDGTLELDENVDNGTVYLNGLCVNVCNRYYTNTLGNNEPFDPDGQI